MNERDEKQLQEILSRGWLTRQQVEQARPHIQSGQGDFCAHLQSWGMLSAQQAELVRAPTKDVLPDLSRESLGPARGLLFDRFEVIGELGRGGMGVVHRARDTFLEREVALKVLSELTCDPVLLDRFATEAKALAKIQHPNVVRIHAFGIERGQPYLVMELVSGMDLEAYCKAHFRKEGRFPTIELLKPLFKGLIEGLVACHDVGLVHRDLKPKNILIEEQSQRAILLDFGLVKRLSESKDDSFASSEGALLGTPAYMSPEQIDRREYGTESPATDLWGLAATLFYCLTGRPPFRSDSNIALLRSILKDPAPGLRSIDPTAPKWLDGVLEQCFQKTPSKRPNLVKLLAELEADRTLFEPKKSFSLGAALLLTLLCVAVGLLFLFTAKLEPLKFAAVQCPKYVKAAPFRITVKLNRMATVRLFSSHKDHAGFTLQSLPKNDQTTHVLYIEDMKEGVWELRIEASDQESKVLESRTLIFDSSPPDLSPLPKRVALPSHGILRGHVVDSSLRSVLIDGELAKVSEDGYFEYQIDELKGVKLCEVVASDHFGRTSTRRMTVYRGDLVTLLTHLEAWDKASNQEQDQAVALAGSLLGDSYEYLGAAVYRVNGASHRIASFNDKRSSIVFNLIPGGHYQMGVEDPKKREKWSAKLGPIDQPKIDFQQQSPKHAVHIRSPFLLARYELSNEQWQANGGEIAAFNRHPKRPATFMQWSTAAKWCEDIGLRLPSEAEWEYACAGGTRTRFFWGDEAKDGLAYTWCKSNTHFFQFVKAHENAPNPFGLIDMTGNAQEWCADERFLNYDKGPFNERAMTGSSFRVLRGGWYNANMAYATTSFAKRVPLSFKAGWAGLRPAKSFLDVSKITFQKD